MAKPLHSSQLILIVNLVLCTLKCCLDRLEDIYMHAVQANMAGHGAWMSQKAPFMSLFVVIETYTNVYLSFIRPLIILSFPFFVYVSLFILVPV